MCGSDTIVKIANEKKSRDELCAKEMKPLDCFRFM